MMTLASEVRDLRALVVETSVRTVEETRAAAASAVGGGRKEREEVDVDVDGEDVGVRKVATGT